MGNQFTYILSLSDPDLIEQEIRRIGYDGQRNAIPFLVDLFQQNRYPLNIQNAIAISLSNLGADEAVKYLMRYVLDPDNQHRRGTVLYALLNLDCQHYFSDF